MTIKRIFASSVVALLLSASSLAAACDLSCAFASVSSDCHSEQTESQDSAPGVMTMDGMAMTEMANGGNQQAVSAISRAKTHHPSIGEMGSCERQACDNGSAVSAKTTPSVNSHSQSTLAITETPRAADLLPLLRGARDAIANYHVRDESPLRPSLRI